jgi:hypothetical protein
MRRVAAFFGLVAVLALAVTLLWRVYLHHVRSEPFAGDGGAMVSFATRPPFA